MLIKCISLIYKCLWREGVVSKQILTHLKKLLGPQTAKFNPTVPPAAKDFLSPLHKMTASTGRAHFRHNIKTYISSFINASVPHFSKWRHICLLRYLISSGINKVFEARRPNRWISNCGDAIYQFNGLFTGVNLAPIFIGFAHVKAITYH